MWADRVEAGYDLARELARRGYGGRDDVVVLGIPRGGVEVAAEVARVLAAPLDVVVVRKIGMPTNPEFAAGAVDLDGRVLANPEAGASPEYLRTGGATQRVEAQRRAEAYRAGRPEPELAKRTAIVVDDGIATGLTAQAAVSYLRRQGATSVVLAVPVMAPQAAHDLGPLVDELVALEIPRGFYAVGAYYASFPQLSDAEVQELLRAAA